MTDIDNIKKSLSGRADSIMSQYYPNAKQVNGNWMMGDLTGAAGQSCKSFHGKSNGVFLMKDNATGETKDIMWLLQSALGVSFKEMLPEARRLCGIATVSPSIQKKEKPKAPKGNGRSTKGTPAHEYLTQDRQLCTEVIEKYKVGYSEFKTDSNEHSWTAPFIDTDGDLVYVKTTGLNKNEKGKKEIRSSTPHSTLWGWWNVDDNTRKIIITEGEIDAMSSAQISSKYPSLSLPSGCADMKWIDHDWDQLSQFETIYLMMDMDEAGDIAAKTISEKLGKARCRRVKIGHNCNDVNELLRSGKGTETYLEGVFSRARTFDPPSILGASDGIEDAIRENEERKEAIKVKNFVFPDMEFKLLDGDTGILTGSSGSGKTDLANLIMLNEMKQGQVVCIVAADTPANDLRTLSAWQIFGHDPDAHEIRLACEAMEGKLFFIDAVNHRMGSAELIKTMEYVTQRYGVTRFLIDNLFEVDDIKKDDYNKQDSFVRDLDKFDKKHRTNSMLVAHALMGDDHSIKKPTLRDIEGSKGMTKPIQYAISIFRNRVRENPDEYEDGDRTPQKVQKLLEGHAAYFNVFKCRNGFRKELSQGLDFDVNSRRFKTPYGRYNSPFEVKLNQDEINISELSEENKSANIPF